MHAKLVNSLPTHLCSFPKNFLKAIWSHFRHYTRQTLTKPLSSLLNLKKENLFGLTVTDAPVFGFQTNIAAYNFTLKLPNPLLQFTSHNGLKQGLNDLASILNLQVLMFCKMPNKYTFPSTLRYMTLILVLRKYVPPYRV